MEILYFRCICSSFDPKFSMRYEGNDDPKKQLYLVILFVCSVMTLFSMSFLNINCKVRLPLTIFNVLILLVGNLMYHAGSPKNYEMVFKRAFMEPVVPTFILVFGTILFELFAFCVRIHYHNKLFILFESYKRQFE